MQRPTPLPSAARPGSSLSGTPSTSILPPPRADAEDDYETDDFTGADEHGGVGFESGTVTVFQKATTASDPAAYAQPAVLGDAPVLPDVVPSTSSYPAAASSAGLLGDGQSMFTSPVSAAALGASLVPEGLDVPLQAPRLRVPATLPLEQTTLLDLLACAVVQGGPTTEEEIVRREVGRHRNPAFAFLGEKFNHPCLLYYRWRLYSLLQGDTLLSWRGQPFQMEAARLAYAWVPPPPLRVGPESLAGLHRPELMASSKSVAAVASVNGSGDGGGRGGGGVAAGAEEDNAETIVRTAHHRHRRRRRRHHRRHDGSHAAERDANTVVGCDAQTEAQPELKRQRREAGTDEGGKEDADAGHRGEQRRSSNNSSRSSSSSSSGSSVATSSGDSSEDGGDTEQDVDGHHDGRRVLGTSHIGGGDADGDRDRRDAGRSTPSPSPSPSPSLLLPQPSQGASSSQPARADPAAGTVMLPPPSAQWISRQCTEHRHVFAVLQPELLSEWTALLNPYEIASPASLSTTTTATPSSPEHVNVVAELSARWLRREEAATRMAFAIRHGEAMHHLLSVLLDAVVRVAYVATAQSRQPPPPQVPSTGSGGAAPPDSNVYCVEALWYLFVLHDIVMNAANIPEASASFSPATAATTPSASTSSGFTSSCVNRNPTGGDFGKGAPQAPPPQPPSPAMPGAFGGLPDVDDDAFATADGSSPEALEALYDALKHQQRPNSNSAASALSTPLSASSGAAAHSPPSPAGPLRPRRRQRNPLRRSSYERCGDALEAILPTLMEACTAIVLAVSLDKERQRSQAQAAAPPPPTSPSAAAPVARVRHFKVLPALSPQQQALQASARQRASEKGKGKLRSAGGDTDDASVSSSAAAAAAAAAAADAAVAAALLAGTGGPCLSLRLDAGCDPSAATTATAPPSTNTSSSSIGGGSGTSSVFSSSAAAGGAPGDLTGDVAKVAAASSESTVSPAAASALPPPPAPSSAPAVLLLDWLKTLVVVWMNAEQPLQLPPSAPVWPRFAEEEVSDLQEVRLTYHVEAAHATLLGLVGASGSPSGRDAYPRPPLLSARGCAVLKERYAFLL